MNNKLVSTASRTILNIFVLGLISAGTIFAVYTLKATGERTISSLADDICSIHKQEKIAA